MKYFIIAGEASGDLHGSNLIKGLLHEDPAADIECWGGDLMRDAGARLLHHYKEGAVMGLTEVIAKAGMLASNIRLCKENLTEFNPDVVILIDYPGFNFKIGEFAHSKGYKVFYYIAPKTWASREGRNRKMKRFVDKLFIVFPFEVDYFSSRGIPFVYKGNPLLDAVDCHSFKRITEERYIALLPGSRKEEIRRMMPVCMEVTRTTGRKVIVAGAPSRTVEDYSEWLEADDRVELVFGRTYDLLKYCDAAIINSGTASLEAALIGAPQVVCWSTSKVTAFVARHILKVLKHIKYISLGNLIADRAVFRELIQEDFNAVKLSAELERLLGDESYRGRMLEGYREIRSRLGGSGTSYAVAAEMIKAASE